MSTGDIKNNLRKLQTELRKIKYSAEIDLDGLTNGNWVSLEPIYQYAFGVYSTPIAEEIQEKLGFQLMSRTENRFQEGLYRILRDLYKYKPPVTRDQFAAQGFSERKIIMCTSILQMVQTRHGEITGRFSRASQISTASDTIGRLQTYRTDTGHQNPPSPVVYQVPTDTVLQNPMERTIEVDLPMMEAGPESSDVSSENEMQQIIGEIQVKTKEEQNNEEHSDLTTFWEFQKIVEKNFNKIIGRLTLLEARMAAIETKIDMIQPKDRSLVQRVKPMVKSN